MNAEKIEQLQDEAFKQLSDAHQRGDYAVAATLFQTVATFEAALQLSAIEQRLTGLANDVDLIEDHLCSLGGECTADMETHRALRVVVVPA
jgi:cytochrome c556